MAWLLALSAGRGAVASASCVAHRGEVDWRKHASGVRRCASRAENLPRIRLRLVRRAHRSPKSRPPGATTTESPARGHPCRPLASMPGNASSRADNDQQHPTRIRDATPTQPSLRGSPHTAVSAPYQSDPPSSSRTTTEAHTVRTSCADVEASLSVPPTPRDRNSRHLGAPDSATPRAAEMPADASGRFGTSATLGDECFEMKLFLLAAIHSGEPKE